MKPRLVFLFASRPLVNQDNLHQDHDLMIICKDKMYWTVSDKISKVEMQSLVDTKRNYYTKLVWEPSPFPDTISYLVTEKSMYISPDVKIVCLARLTAAFKLPR